MEKTAVVKKKAAAVSKDVKPEMKSSLAGVMVRIDPKEANYVPMYQDSMDASGGKGWFVGAGHPRVPELHKDTRLLLTAATRDGCALFATEGGIRIMLSPSGKGAVGFITCKDATKGEEIYIFNQDVAECEKVGVKVTRESKGVYASMRDTEGNIVYSKLKANFKTTKSPMDFKKFAWPGMQYTPEEDTKKEGKKKSSNGGDGPQKKNGPGSTAKAAEAVIATITKKSPVAVPKAGHVVKKPLEGKRAAG